VQQRKVKHRQATFEALVSLLLVLVVEIKEEGVAADSMLHHLILLGLLTMMHHLGPL
jgi:hypothetical protein